MRYLPHTEAEITAMLERVGAPSIDALFSPIPEAHRLGRPLALEPALDEARLMRHLVELADKNGSARALSFLGGGIYDHHIPPAVDQLLLRNEFYTAYTPYQAEVSQGTLQAIYEFQTIVSELFGMEVANASMYDGASAAAEAVTMARRVTKRRRCLVSAGLHPHYRETIATYLRGVDGDEPLMSEVPLGEDGRTDMAAARALMAEHGKDVCALFLQQPNFFGCVEDLAEARSVADEGKALLLSATSEPYALSVVAPPGHFGVDIAVGEGQALAVPPQLGGPGVGLFACSKKHVRQMPGRLVGETVDADGERGFVLTLSTREQHIRRERATSNICTNHGLIALAMTIRTACLGRRGFEEAGRLCLSLAEHLKAELAAIEGLSLPYGAPTFNEMLVRVDSGDAAPLLEALAKEGILAGVPVGAMVEGRQSDFLVAVTEKHDKADLDRLVAALKSHLS